MMETEFHFEVHPSSTFLTQISYSVVLHNVIYYGRTLGRTKIMTDIFYDGRTLSRKYLMTDVLLTDVLNDRRTS
jgi:hypothetical protein